MAGTESGPPPDPARYGVLAFACTLAMVTYLDRVCFGAAASIIARELGLADTSGLKWAFTAFAVAYAVFEIPGGWMGDRWGPRRTLLRIVVWWSLCTALTGLAGLKAAGPFWGGMGALIALRFAFGAGEAGAFPNITRALHNWFPASERAAAQGWVWTCGRIAGGLTPLLWVALVGDGVRGPLSWRGAFLAFGAVGLVWCTAFALRFRDRPEAVLRTTPAAHPAVPWGALLRSRTLLALCAMYFLVSYAWVFNITYLPSYMKDRYGPAAAGAFGSLLQGGPLWVGAFGCLLGGPCAARVGLLLGDRARGRRLFCGASLACGAPCWLAAREADTAVGFFALASAAAFFLDLALGASWATCQDIGGAHAGVVAAFMNTVGVGGAAVAGWSTGAVVEAALAARAEALDVAVRALPAAAKLAAQQSGYAQAFLSYAAAFALAAVCWFFIDPSRPIAADPSPPEETTP